MGIILLVLLLALTLAGIGAVVHVLWWIAIIVFVFWLVGWAVARGEAAGSGRRRWFGRY